jgi:hypothetical protein
MHGEDSRTVQTVRASIGPDQSLAEALGATAADDAGALSIDPWLQVNDLDGDGV